YLTRNTFGFRMDVAGPVLLALMAFNIALGWTAPFWSGRRGAWTVFSCVHVIGLTIVLHFLGGIRMGILLCSSVFPVFQAAMLGPDVSAFVTANLAAFAYAILAYFEGSGWLVSHGVVLGGIEPGQETMTVFLAWAVLNFLALHASRYGYHLRHRA